MIGKYFQLYYRHFPVVIQASYSQMHVTLKNFLGEQSFASPICRCTKAEKVHQMDLNPGPHDQWANDLTTRVPTTAAELTENL